MRHQCACIREGAHLGSVVLGCSDDHGKVHRRLDVIDLLVVLLDRLQDVPRLGAATDDDNKSALNYERGYR